MRVPAAVRMLVGITVAVSACGTQDATAPPTAGLRILWGDGVTDTILTPLDQTLMVEVRSERGVPVQGTQVRFDPVERGGQPDVYITYPSSTSFLTLLDDTTDALGLVAVRVKLGVHAGAAKLRLSVPQLGFQDTARFTILPGHPAQVVVTPGDTAVYAGASFQSSATVFDTWGNLRTDQATFSPLTGVDVTSTGKITAGANIARASYTATVAGTASVAAASGTGWVSIVPHGTLVAYHATYYPEAPSLVTFNLDGSGYHEIAPILYLEASAWTPSGTTFVFGGAVQPGFLWMYTSDLAGNVQRLGTPQDSGLTSVSWPVYSPDGQALYFTGYAAPYQYSLWRADADGRNPHLLYADPSGIAWRESLSPDGTRLAFTAENPAIIRVYTIASRTVSSWSVRGHTPRWSPTSDSIAFATQWGGPIHLMKSDGTGMRQVSAPNRSYSETSIAWSPDGAWLVARGAVLELINVASGLTLPLGYTGALAEPVWKP